MKIAVLYSNHPTAGWSMSEGIVRTLRRLGHTVLDVPMPTEREASEHAIGIVKQNCPKLDDLKAQDAIIVSGPEHIGPWIDAVWGKYEWKNLGVPRSCWLHESCTREDYNVDFDAIKWCGDEWFFPAIQDAEMHDQEMFAAGRSHYLPFGVDTEIFKPYLTSKIEHELSYFPSTAGTHFDIGFIGLLYPKRKIFLQALSRHAHPGVRCGMVNISDLHGYDREGSMRLLASNTRQIKVFFNLPSMSRLLVSKVVETMACGTFLMTPLLPEYRGAEKNLELFKTGEHLIYYSPSNMAYTAQLLREWITPEKDADRARIAEAGCREVHAKHSLRIRLESLLEKLKVSASAHA